MKVFLSFVSFCLLAGLLHAATTPIPDTIQLNGFSVTYKIDDPYSWNVSVPADKSSVSYKYVEAGRKNAEQSREGMAEFTISRVSVRARLRMENAATVANEIIKQDVQNALGKAYDSKITLSEDADEKMESSIGSVFFYKSNPFLMRQSRDLLKRAGNFQAYAALVLPDDYAKRGVAYAVTCAELNNSRMEKPVHLDIFRAFILGLKEDAGAKDAVAPQGDIMREPVFTGKYYKIDEVDTPPKQRGRPQEPVYPRELKSKTITGSAVIGYIVDTKGYTDQVQIGFATHKEFGESAAKAVEKWRYDPATKNGAAVNCVMFMPIEFTITDDAVAPVKKQASVETRPTVKKEPVFKMQYYGASEVDTQPEVKPMQRNNFPTPRNPSSLIRRGITHGDVLIAFIVDAKGIPQEVQVEESNFDEYANDAVKAVQTWRFKPAIKNGVPVNCRVQAPFSFNLEG